MDKREHTPIVSEAQRRFFFSERDKRKKERSSGMSTRILEGHLKEAGGKKLPKVSKITGGVMVDTKLRMFVPITKVDEEQRMVYGLATTSGLDKQNEIVDWDATKKALVEYSQWRNVREMHKPSAVGIAPLIEARDEKQEVYIGAKIVDEQAWQKCKEGVYKGFSIGGEVLDRKIEFNKTTGKSINRVTNYVLNEISVVDRPANPLCRFETVKRDTSIETITITEDPLKAESAKLMEKAVSIAKRTLSKVELENLPDDSFGLIKVVADGDKLIKHRQYPMPDKTHAINMVKKMTGCDDLSNEEKVRIHTIAVSVLGKKHVEGECPYCVKQKLEGGVKVENKEIKVEKKFEEKTAVPPAEPEKKDATIPAEKPAEEQKPNIKVEDEAPASGADAVSPIDQVNTKLDRLISLMTDLLGSDEEVSDVPKADDVEEPVDDCVETKADDDEEEDEAPKVDAKSVEEVAREESDKTKEEPVAKEEEEDECVKGAGIKKVTAIAKSGIMSKMQAIMEPMMKENKALRDRLEKLEKAPLPRKGAVGDGKVKVEKFEAPKGGKQDMVIQKNEITFSEPLLKDITKAKELRMSGKALSAEETSFCQRVAEKMLEEKLTKVS